MTEIGIREKLECVERELKYRARVYERLVQRGKMSEPQRQHEIKVMGAIAEDYRRLFERERLV
ncbi:hypothetical protein A1D31_22500 [Bradyrhizobium liaoningense]|nr:hypothetical protein A1D31_22500 [Bradyrhizobium liaoningense]